MIATDRLYILQQRFVWVRVADWWISCIRAVHHVYGLPFQASGNVSVIQHFFMRNVWEGWLRLMCLTGTWVPSWFDVILIWYQYIVNGIWPNPQETADKKSLMENFIFYVVNYTNDYLTDLTNLLSYKYYTKRGFIQLLRQIILMIMKATS